jgi:uncharacterized membrane protein
MTVKKKLQFSKNEAIKFGFQTAKGNIVFFIGVFVIVTIVFSLTSFLQNIPNLNQNAGTFLIGNILAWILNLIIDMGIIRIALKFVDLEKPAFSDLFQRNSLINYVLTSIISCVIIVIGLILFIIPGIIFAFRLQFSKYLVIDKKLGPVEAIQKSWKMTKGVTWNLFLLCLLFILINILGFIALIIGLFITVPLTMVANAFVYRKLLSQVK